MASQVPVRPVLQQFVTTYPRQTRLVSSSLARAVPLTAPDTPPLQDSLRPNDISVPTSAQSTIVNPPISAKTRGGTSPLFRLNRSPPNAFSSRRSISVTDIPPASEAPASPLLAALLEAEEPRSAWPNTELQRPAMEDVVSKTRHLWIDPQRIHPEEEQAHSWGSSGELWRCWLSGETARELKRVAVKRIKFRPEDGRSNRRLLQHILREVVSWNELDHPNIAPFIGYTYDGRSAMVVSKWQEGGDIRKYLPCDPMTGLRIAHQVASGLAYLHSRAPPIVHGDIRPENILIGADGIARLADFGLSMILDETLSRGLRTSNGCRHTLLYADPVLLDDVPQTVDTDLWALGWVIYELVTSRKPYDHRKTPHAIFRAVVAYDLPTRDTHAVPYPELLWPVLEACWSQDFSRRWPAANIASHLTQASDPKIGIRLSQTSSQ